VKKNVINAIESPVPICKECKHIFFFKKGRFIKHTAGALCSAQGYRNASGVYNTPECRKLYKNKNITEEK
jgi:hypothetical protein